MKVVTTHSLQVGDLDKLIACELVGYLAPVPGGGGCRLGDLCLFCVYPFLCIHRDRKKTAPLNKML